MTATVWTSQFASPAVTLRKRFGACHVRGEFDQLAAWRHGEQRVAVANGERLAGRGGAGVHDDRPPATDRFWFGANLFELDEDTVYVELIRFGPGQFYRIQPLLSVPVARLVGAQIGAEHGELILVPAADDVQSEAPAADVIGGDELFRGDKGMEHWRMDGAEHGDALRGGK